VMKETVLHKGTGFTRALMCSQISWALASEVTVSGQLEHFP
jgi:hypothetical protein